MKSGDYTLPDVSGPKRAVIYARVSTIRQAETDYDEEGFSLPAQIEACQRKADELGAEVVQVFIDRGESARTLDRPQLQGMLKLLATERAIAFVIVHKVNRWARNRVDDVGLQLQIRSSGATLVSASENIDETPAGQLLHGLLATVAEFESANLATEVRKGMVKKAKKGGTPHRAPIGYLNFRDNVVGERRGVASIKIDAERAPKVKRAFQLYASGNYSLDQLVVVLAEDGLTSRATRRRPELPLSRSHVARMLSNRYYIGLVEYAGAIYDGRHEPLIEKGVWEQVQSVLAAHANSGEKQRLNNHYLKGTVYCGRCGSRLVLNHVKNRHGVYYDYWFCMGRQRREGCTQRYMPSHLVEAAVERHYATVQRQPAQVAHIRRTLMHAFEEDRSRAKDRTARAKRRLAALDAERTKLMQAFYAEAVPLDLFKREQSRIATEALRLETHLDTLRGDFDAIEANLDKALALLGDAENCYAAASRRIRRLLNQLLFAKLLVDDNDVVDAELAPIFAAILSPELDSEAKPPSITRRESSKNDRTPRLFAGGSSNEQLVREGGLEPPHPFGHRNLNPARLPIPPLARSERAIVPADLPASPSARALASP